MTGDHDALLRAICENPREDTPRLVFADWLEENPDSFFTPDVARARAGFIRTDVEMYARPAWDGERARYEFAARNAPTLAGELAWFTRLTGANGDIDHWAGDPRIRRGFPWAVRAPETSHDQFKLLGELTARNPVERVEFSRSVPDLRQLARASWAAKLSGLKFQTGRVSPTALGMFLVSSSAGALEELLFWSEAISDEGVAVLVHSEVFTRLLSLSLRDNFAHVATAFLAATAGPGEARLRSLDLCSARLGERVQELAGHPILAQLEDLNVGRNHVDANRVLPLAASPRARNLKRLVAYSNPMGNAGAAALFTSPHLAGLKVLDLSYCMVGDEALRALLENSPLADGLNLLILTGSPASADMKQAVKDRMGDRVRL